MAFTTAATAGHSLSPPLMPKRLHTTEPLSSCGEGVYGGQVGPPLLLPHHEANSRDTTETLRDDAADPDRDDPGTRSRVTRVDASTHVNEHDHDVDTLLTPAKRVRGPRSGSYPRPLLGTRPRGSKRARRPIPRLTQPRSFRDLRPASGP